MITTRARNGRYSGPLTAGRWIRGGMFLFVLAGIMLSGCGRGLPSEKPPIHINPNMDDQEKYKSQAMGRFFADSSAMRMPSPGTLARGELRAETVFYQGKDSSGAYVARVPVAVDMLLLRRGRERFDIYCSPCHSRVGDGRGIMIQRGYVPPPSFHDDRIRTMPDGQIFGTITGGVRNMPSYAHQVPPADRWAIVAYLRALERSHNATLNDVPPEDRNDIRQAGQ
jgi:mono/diheme cytochrome c family protein